MPIGDIGGTHVDHCSPSHILECEHHRRSSTHNIFLGIVCTGETGEIKDCHRLQRNLVVFEVVGIHCVFEPALPTMVDEDHEVAIIVESIDQISVPLNLLMAGVEPYTGELIFHVSGPIRCSCIGFEVRFIFISIWERIDSGW